MTYYRSLLPALREAGAEIHVIEGSALHAGHSRAPRKRDGVAVETLEAARLSRWFDKFSAYAAIPAVRRHLAAAWAMWEQANFGTGADIVEAADWGLLFVPPVIEARCPLVVHCHGSIGQIADHDPIADDAADELFVRLIEREVLSIAPAIQTYSSANAKFWEQETGNEVARLLPAWSRPHDFAPLEPTDRGLVVGRLQSWKGPQIVCEALRLLGTRVPIVDWVGRDTAWKTRKETTSNHIARMFPDLWGKTLVHHAPTLPEEIAGWQAQASFNIVPSTWDVFNFTVAEAMASGRPTIVSTGAGASELIEDGKNGFLFQSNDPEALATTIDRVLRQSSLRLTEIGHAAKETVRSVLDPTKIAQQRIAAYREAINSFDEHTSLPIGGWLGAVCRPSGVTGNDMMFLENFPIRKIAKHVLTRTWRRVCRP